MKSRFQNCRNPKTLCQGFIGLAVVVLVLVTAIVPSSGASAQSTITVETNQADYVFSQKIDFTLEAASPSQIVSVILFYGQQGQPLVRRIYPTYKPGKSITARFTEEVMPGQYAPGTVMRYYWQLTTQDGAAIRTAPLYFTYEDTNHDWQLIEGEVVDLYWYGNKGALAKELVKKADTDAHSLEQRYGITLDTRLRIYVYNSTKDMSKALASRSEGYDEAITTLGVTVSDTTMLLLGSHRDVRDTLAHELSHLVLGLVIDNPFARLPRWLDEGLAMYAEGELPDQNRSALEEGIRNNSLLTIRSMTSYTGLASQVDLFYGEAYSIVDFLVKEFGEEKLQDFIQVLAQGARQEEALQQVYGFGLDELDLRWRASIGAQPLPTHKPAEGNESTLLVPTEYFPSAHAQIAPLAGMMIPAQVLFSLDMAYKL